MSCQKVNVASCPTTLEEWNRASMAKKCLSNGCSPNSVYHCVADENMKPVEVCAEPIYLQGKYIIIDLRHYFVCKVCIVIYMLLFLIFIELPYISIEYLKQVYHDIHVA